MAQANPVTGVRRDPKTKEDLLNRMMSRDFSGDLADLAVGRDLRMERIRPHVIRLKFGESGQEFDLTIHKPRTGEKKAAAVTEQPAAAARKKGNGRKRAGPAESRAH